MAANSEFIDAVKEEARRIAVRDLRRIQRLIRRELRELQDADPDEEE